jgi:hypothetical protein
MRGVSKALGALHGLALTWEYPLKLAVFEKNSEDPALG